MINYSKKLSLTLLLLLTPSLYCALDKAPKLTVVIVIDQCAYHYFPKLKKNFRYGFKELLKNGVVYTKALHPHGVPETAPGHHAISTGCYPKDHGVVTNQWINERGEKVRFETDTNPDAKIIPNFSNKSIGKSGRNCMVDNLSDQFLQFDTPQNPAQVFALSIKSYPAIAMAGKMGKAVWFDENRGMFVSSQMYFKKLPNWIESCNNKIHSSFADYQWNPTFKLNSPEYNYPFVRNYEFSEAAESYIGKYPLKINPLGAQRYFTLIRTPFANSMLVELAKACVNQNLNLQSNDRMLLWVSFSQLDLLGHLFGPDSLEAIDSMYQLDRQINDFITFLQRKVGAHNCLIAFTADHGIASIPEIQKKKGFPGAQRVLTEPLIQAMNNEVKRKLGTTDIVEKFEPNSFWLNKTKCAHLSRHKKAKILETLVAFLKKYPGIQDAWTYHELEHKDVSANPFALYYKMQLFAGRTGEIICQPAPHCQITHYKTGTGHSTPYNYDTHVPLILYQPGVIRPQIITQPVFIPQLPVTLATLLHITKPSASGFDVLPGFTRQEII